MEVHCAIVSVSFYVFTTTTKTKAPGKTNTFERALCTAGSFRLVSRLIVSTVLATDSVVAQIVSTIN